jgi:plasmid maintenance system killer protein
MKNFVQTAKNKLRKRAVRQFNQNTRRSETIAQEWGHKGVLAKKLDMIRLATTLHELKETNPFADQIIQ